MKKRDNGESCTVGSFIICTPPNIIRQIKSRKMRWAGHVGRLGEGRNVYTVLVGKPKEKDNLKDQGVDGRKGSKWTLGRLVGGCGVDSPGSG
jgi:hypothetical protein